MKTRRFFLLILLAVATFQVQAQTVSVSGRQMSVNGVRYRINGICYSRGGFGNYTQDIALLKEANINTIRTYSPINDKAELDAFANAGIRIIMHLDENNYETYINTYKSHSAILMWEFGNEFNYHADWFGGNINTWYTKLQDCATRAHQLDTNHPVTTAHGEVPTAAVLAACPAVDIWGMNLYRWDNDVPALTDFAARSTKAMYVSECGGDSYNKATNQMAEDQQTQANKNIVNGITSKYDICVGVAVFEFCDEWWKAGNDAIQNPGGSAPNSSGVPYDGSADEEYWGIVRRDRSKKPAFTDLKAIYGALNPNTDCGTTYTAIPAKIENENYCNMAGVTSVATTDLGGGNHVATIDKDDWMAYSITVPTSGQYTVNYRVASSTDGSIQFEELGGTKNYGSIAFTSSGAMDKWKTISQTVDLTAGNHSIAIKALVGGFNLNWMTINNKGVTTIEAEDYDNGGANVSFSDITPTNEGGQYRTDAVDIEAGGTGYDVGYIANGEWLQYTLPSLEAGTYDISIPIACPVLKTGQNINIKINGISVGTLTPSNTGAWTTFKEQTISGITISGNSSKTLKLEFAIGDFNIDYIKFVRTSATSLPINSGSNDALVNVYPLPVTDILRVFCSDKTIEQIEVYSISGIKLLSVSNESTVDMSELSQGVYVVAITVNGKTAIRKVIKK